MIDAPLMVLVGGLLVWAVIVGVRWLYRREANPVASPDSVVWMKSSALSGGVRILSASGSGKTVLAATLAFDLWLKQQRACYVFDPTGSFFASFISRFRDFCQQQRLTPAQIAALEARVVVCELGANNGSVMRAGQCVRFTGESMTAAVERVLAWVLAGRPETLGAAVMGFTAMEKILTPFLYLAIANELSLTDLPDLLQNPKSKLWQQRYDRALAHYPQECTEAVKFWKEEYSRWDKGQKRQMTTSVESFLKPYRYNEVWRASLGASVCDFDDERFIAEGCIVFVIGSGMEGEDQRQLLDWHMRRFLAYIRQRGSGSHHPKVALFIDEISLFYTPSEKGMEIWAQLLGELVQVLKRQFQIHPLVVMHQSQSQVHPLIAHHLAALSNQIIGKPADHESALMLAPQLFEQRPVIKGHEPVLMNVPQRGIQVVHRRPVAYRPEEVLQQQAEILLSLDRFKFLCRLSPWKEGGRRTALQQLDVVPMLGSMPDEAWVAQKRCALAQASGVALGEALQEIAGRAEREMNPSSESATLDAPTATVPDELSVPALPPGVEAVPGGYMASGSSRRA